ncbi:WD repeat domain phosphoinositide-interacting protein 2-like [Rhopilema esculentum]|uniref:WD repeat domain phosphoinositide-interacting protein 2-like n=1 Tax=Rhopilema esculentum TaxID=499914 RepID=UPI0031D37776
MNLAANGGDPSGDLLFANFNQDVTSLAVGSRLGYKLYSLSSIEKLEEIHDYDKDDVCIVERLFSSSLVAIVSLSAPRKLKVCHFKKGTEICNYSYPNTILAVKLNRVRLLVTLEESLYIHNIRDMKVLHTIRDTPPNPSGLCALSSNSDNCYLAYPGSNQIGEIQIFDAVNLRAVTMIPAHDSPVASLTFNSSANLLASASEKGTVIRVFSIPSGQKLFEFRRGVKRCAHIYSLSFSMDSFFLAASSNTETVHIFKLEAPKEKTADEPQSWVGYFGKALMTPSNFLPSQFTEVLAQERAFATIKLAHGGHRNICALASINKLPRVLVANEDGYLYVYKLDLDEGGECSLLRQHRLLPDGRERSGSADSGRASSGMAISAPKSGQATASHSSPRSLEGQSPKSARGSSFNEGNLKLNDETEYPPLTVHNE